MKVSRNRTCCKVGIKMSLSTRKASNILQNLVEEGIYVPIPLQVGMQSRVVKDAERVMNRLKEIIGEEEYCLHFDGKKIGSKEYRVVCAKISARTLHFDNLDCESGSGEDIFIPMQVLLDECIAWKCQNDFIRHHSCQYRPKLQALLLDFRDILLDANIIISTWFLST